uniref:Transmembrane protein n=1 Tax=Pyrodinium bahamense TaxID=73915 RepID=A0A7S0FYF4_9DINO
MSAKQSLQRSQPAVLTMLAVVLLAYALLFGPKIGASPSAMSCQKRGARRRGRKLTELPFRPHEAFSFPEELDVFSLHQWWLLVQIVQVVFRALVRHFPNAAIFAPSRRDEVAVQLRVQERVEDEIFKRGPKGWHGEHTDAQAELRQFLLTVRAGRSQEAGPRAFSGHGTGDFQRTGTGVDGPAYLAAGGPAEIRPMGGVED